MSRRLDPILASCFLLLGLMVQWLVRFIHAVDLPMGQDMDLWGL